MKQIIRLTFLFLVFSSVRVFAHEYWLEPEKFFLAPNEKTSVRLFVGDGLTKDREEKDYQPEKTNLFQLFSKDKTLDLKTSAVGGALPVFEFSAADPGNYLLAMERNWSYIKLDAAKFEEYLREDAMEYIIAERAKLGESDKEAGERYSRYLKSIVQVGGKTDATYKKRLGMKMEIVPLENPYLKKAGDKLKLQIFFDGKPLADKTVFADHRDGETQKVKTDKNGKFSIKLERKGLWLVRMVFMRRCAKDCGEASWESFWTALTFGV